MKKIILPILLFIMFLPFYVNAEICDSCKISISSISIDEKSNNVEEIDEASVSGMNINLNLSMSKVGDKIDYKIVVKNDSNEDYELDKNSFNISSDYIDYKLKSDDNSNIVKANSSKTVYLKIEYKNEVSPEAFESGVYNDNKSMTLNIFTRDIIKNPNTGVQSCIIILTSILVISVSLYVALRKKKYAKFMVFILVGSIIIPVSAYAICKCEIKVNFNIILKKDSGDKATDKIKRLVIDHDPSDTDVIEAEKVSESCTNTLAFDGTSDNNLRYVGNNPCNFVKFNGEEPETRVVYREIDKRTNGVYSIAYSTMEECNANLFNSNYYECRKRTEVYGGWRIIGVMNNVDNGSGVKETRIKLMRTNSLGYYSWDSSEGYWHSNNDMLEGANYGEGVNDWTQADIMHELNGDFLDLNLKTNSMWFNYKSNKKTAEYDYTKGLNSKSQSLIGNAKWYLGGVDEEYYSDGTGMARKWYLYEKGTKTFGYSPEQICNDGACPRATEWVGKVALVYPSDYGFAVGGTVRNLCLNKNLYDYDSDDCGINQWIPVTWTITQETSYQTMVFMVYNEEGSAERAAFYSEPVVPVVYLKKDVLITDGNGSIESPYVLDLN